MNISASERVLLEREEKLPRQFERNTLSLDTAAEGFNLATTFVATVNAELPNLDGLPSI
jgi:hypothetical protein